MYFASKTFLQWPKEGVCSFVFIWFMQNTSQQYAIVSANFCTNKNTSTVLDLSNKQPYSTQTNHQHRLSKHAPWPAKVPKIPRVFFHFFHYLGFQTWLRHCGWQQSSEEFAGLGIFLDEEGSLFRSLEPYWTPKQKFVPRDIGTFLVRSHFKHQVFLDVFIVNCQLWEHVILY